MNFSWLLSSRNFFQSKKIWQISWATENHQDEILRCPLITALGFHCPIYPAGKDRNICHRSWKRVNDFLLNHRDWIERLVWLEFFTGILLDTHQTSLLAAWDLLRNERPLVMRTWNLGCMVARRSLCPNWERTDSWRRWPPYWKKIQKWMKAFWRHLYKVLWTYCVLFKNCDEACPFPSQMPIFF